MSETKFRIWSDYHKAWWRPNGAGYTNFRSAAGIYSKSEIYTKRDKPIPVDDPWDFHEESKRETARIEAALKAEQIRPRWTPREIADRLMQRGLMLIYEDRAEVVDIETALTEIMGEEG